MRQNIVKGNERGANLDELQNRTDALATQANGFRRGANRVRKQMWWKDMKMRMCIIVGIIILLIVIIVPSGKFAHPTYPPGLGFHARVRRSRAERPMHGWKFGG